MTSPTDIPGVPEPGSIGARTRALLLLADFANTDAGNKINVIGGGWRMTQRMPVGPQGQRGLPPQALVIVIDIPAEFSGTPVPVSVALHNGRDEVVELQGPTGPQPLRIAQNLTPAVDLSNVPHGVMSARAQFLINLDAGTPLDPGDVYTWKLEVNGYSNPQWQTSFYVAQEATPPVIG